MVAVAYESQSFTRRSNYRLSAGKNLVFWIGGRLQEVVAHGGSTVFLSIVFKQYTIVVFRMHLNLGGLCEFRLKQLDRYVMHKICNLFCKRLIFRS